MDRDDEYVLAAAAMFHAAAMQQLGKLVDPSTGEARRDLEQARFSIDVVAALEKKTQGQVPEEVTKQLQHLGFELRMNYLEEAKAQSGAEASESPEAEADPAASTDPSTTPPEPSDS